MVPRLLALVLAVAGGFQPQPLRRQRLQLSAGGMRPPREKGALGKRRARERLEKKMREQGLEPPAPQQRVSTRTVAPPAPAGAPARARRRPPPRQRRRPRRRAAASSAPIGMPERWRKVPVCDRPNRWREGVSQEECDAAEDGRPAPARSRRRRRWSRRTQPVGSRHDAGAAAVDELQGRRAAAHLAPGLHRGEPDQRRPPAPVVVKYYSPQCKACLKIAAKYRRLALDLADDVDCFEVDTVASRPLVKFMNVTKVPSIQIFDPAGIVRLGDSPCMPQDFDRVRHKIDVARTSIKRRRKIHAWALRGPAAPVRAPHVLRATRSALGVAVSGSGSARPTARLSNDDLATFMDTTDEWISQRTGIRARRVLSPDESLAQLSADAGTSAESAASTEDVGLVILATSSPDDLFGDATAVAKACGCANAVAFDLTAACSGFLFDRGRNSDGKGRCDLSCEGTRSARPLAETGIVVAEESAYGPIAMNGNKVYVFATKRVPEVILEALDHAGLGVDDVDWLLLHQANVRIMEAAAKRLGIPMDKVLVSLDECGNTSAGSIPIALDDAIGQGKVQQGDVAH
ncbi:beta-ketoacyl-acyl-carrier-protein synthase III [Aureococcus anophagefferens]|nr:beta-ketoacyl-acyl-carrier-protein synthase III [Aureococcus anophagefferens]